MDCSPSSSSVHEISQARILEWVAISFSMGILTQELNIHFLCVSCIVRGFFTVESPQKHLAFSYKHCCIFNIKYKICWFYTLFLILHMKMCISPTPPPPLDCFLAFRFYLGISFKEFSHFPCFFSTPPSSTHAVYNIDHSNLFVYSWPTHTRHTLIMNKCIMNGRFRK